MADGILAAVNENGNVDRFVDTNGGVHYIEPKRYEESVAKIDAAATKAQETVNSATEAISECKAQTGTCAQETARAKEIADTAESRITTAESRITTAESRITTAESRITTAESRITRIEGDVATLRDSVSPTVPADTVDVYQSVQKFHSPSTDNWNNVLTYTIPKAGLYFLRLVVSYYNGDYGEATFRLAQSGHPLDARISIEQTAKSAEGIHLWYSTSEVYRFKQGDSLAVQCYTRHAGFGINNQCGVHVVRIGA